MQILNWITANREMAAIVLGIAVNVLGLVYNVYKFLRSGKAKNLTHWIEILEAARRFEVEAETHTDYNSAEKLDYVLTRLNRFCAEAGYPYEEEKLMAQIEEDIAFSKSVNRREGDFLE